MHGTWEVERGAGLGGETGGGPSTLEEPPAEERFFLFLFVRPEDSRGERWRVSGVASAELATTESRDVSISAIENDLTAL